MIRIETTKKEEVICGCEISITGENAVAIEFLQSIAYLKKTLKHLTGIKETKINRMVKRIEKNMNFDKGEFKNDRNNEK